MPLDIKPNPKLNGPARDIFKNVMHAMQDAEEISGPDPVDYVDLMHAIANEAMARAHTCHDTYIRGALKGT